MARMNGLAGWEEPGQTPEFDEYTLVLGGTVRVSTNEGGIDVSAGQAVIAHKGAWVRFLSRSAYRHQPESVKRGP